MRVRASLWVSLAAVVLLSPAMLVARLVESNLLHLSASRVVLPQSPPLPPSRLAAPAAERTAQAPAFQPLGMVRNAPEELALVPDHFFWLRPNLMAAQDPDGQLVFFGDDGHISGRATLPADFAIGDVAPGASAVRIIDNTGLRQISIARNLDPSAIRSIQALPITPDGTARAKALTRRNADTLELRPEGRPRARPLDIRSVTGAPLAQAYDIGPGTGDARFVVSEEIAAVAPRLTVRVFVRRYNRAGDVTGIVSVPIDDFEVVPHDFIAVTGKGELRVLAPTASGVVIRHYEFTAPPRGGQRLREEDLKTLGRNLRQVDVETRVARPDPLDSLRDATDPPLEVVLPPPPPISREKILANARAYLTVNWIMQPENYSRPGIDNVCNPRQGYLWLRPRHFSRALIGKTIGPMPYRWGGEDIPSSFQLRVEWGALAGNVCTCRDPALNYCLVPDSAGIDCSGFVSRAWGIDKRGTAGLLDVSDEVKSIADIAPGDAFDWPQRHVRLFTGMASGAETAFTVLEASTRYECEGVCEQTYRPSELNGYRIIRYRNIREGDVASTEGTAAPVPAPPAASPAPEPEATPAAPAKKHASTRQKTRTRAARTGRRR